MKERMSRRTCPAATVDRGTRQAEPDALRERTGTSVLRRPQSHPRNVITSRATTAMGRSFPMTTSTPVPSATG